MKKAILMLLVLVAAHVSKAQKPGVVISDKPGWHKIGEVTASFKMENESIVVLGADKFKSIKLKVTDANLDLESLEVYYESGDVDNIAVKSSLKAGSETRVIDVKDKSSISKVVFKYKTYPNMADQKAHVELYGLK
ncbi:MAG: hypothetical protein JWP12_3527 [Bacteroidetes bacterium]|jgi:hypothetical protein|nr:hypothetical protein [Bacteroidota bacterium]